MFDTWYNPLKPSLPPSSQAGNAFPETDIDRSFQLINKWLRQYLVTDLQALVKTLIIYQMAMYFHLKYKFLQCCFVFVLSQDLSKYFSMMWSISKYTKTEYKILSIIQSIQNMIDCRHEGDRLKHLRQTHFSKWLPLPPPSFSILFSTC